LERWGKIGAIRKAYQTGNCQKSIIEKNTIKDAVPEGGEQDGGPPFPADTAEYVAQKILEGIESGEAEILAHDWIKEEPTQTPNFVALPSEFL